MELSIFRKIVFAVSFILLLASSTQAQVKNSIRLGWQTPWATQGQLVMGLKHSNIPKLTGINLDYVGFTYGAPLNYAALAGKVDVLLTADQPAIALMARQSGFKVVARMMYNRTCLYVPPNSPIHDMKSLEGMSVAGPIGAAAERVAIQAMKDDGVNLPTIQFGKIDMAQQAALISAAKPEATKWGNFDALYGFDPFPARLQAEGRAEMLHCGKVVSMVLASSEMLDSRHTELTSFLKAFKLSWGLFVKEGNKMDEIFLEESKLNAPLEALAIAASIEPNKNVKSVDEINLNLSEEDYNVIDQAVNYLYERKVLKQKIDPRSETYTDLSIVTNLTKDTSLSTLLKQVKVNK